MLLLLLLLLQTCRLVTRHTMAAADALVEAFDAKARSVFCLEPPGFGMHRKSQVDALTLGCIPVIFTPECDQALWSLHWGSWREDSRVLIDMEDVLVGKLDVQEVLKAIPAARMRQMQETIAQNAHRMHYGLDDTPGDALEVLLRGLADFADDVTVTTAPNGSLVRTKHPTDPLDLPAPLEADCVDHPLEGRLRDALPEELKRAAQGGGGGEAEACASLRRLLVGDGPGQAATCAQAKVVKVTLQQVYLDDVCPRTCGLCPALGLWDHKFAGTP